ncbi:TadE/TadG family type IV pilus assembly protein [Streptomyces chattanoogensis]|uniref:TadE/TadG family type IV pilus assembly protein n=1 Tax=Streptomyces chattanoogensis TaxID=66876 RepID=UPI003684FCB3
MTPSGRTAGADRGSESVQAAIVTPLVLMMLSLVIAGGRLVLSGSYVDAAAQDAAREASLARTATDAKSSALTAARTALGKQGVSCLHSTVTVDTSTLSKPAGQAASVTATVRCTVNLTDLLLPVPGEHVIESSFTSVVDTYRQREGN